MLSSNIAQTYFVILLNMISLLPQHSNYIRSSIASILVPTLAHHYYYSFFWAFCKNINTLNTFEHKLNRYRQTINNIYSNRRNFYIALWYCVFTALNSFPPNVSSTYDSVICTHIYVCKLCRTEWIWMKCRLLETFRIR